MIPLKSLSGLNQRFLIIPCQYPIGLNEKVAKSMFGLIQPAQLLTIFNKCIDTLNPKTLDNIVMYETVQSPYQPLLSDLAYKYNYLIAALLAVLIIPRVLKRLSQAKHAREASTA